MTKKTALCTTVFYLLILQMLIKNKIYLAANCQQLLCFKVLSLNLFFMLSYFVPLLKVKKGQHLLYARYRNFGFFFSYCKTNFKERAVYIEAKNRIFSFPHCEKENKFSNVSFSFLHILCENIFLVREVV